MKGLLKHALRHRTQPYSAKCSATRQRDSKPSEIRICVIVCSSQHITIPVTHWTNRTHPGRVNTDPKTANNDCHHDQTCLTSRQGRTWTASMTLS